MGSNVEVAVSESDTVVSSVDVPVSSRNEVR
jgi:hypothetical protein